MKIAVRRTLIASASVIVLVSGFAAVSEAQSKGATTPSPSPSPGAGGPGNYGGPRGFGPGGFGPGGFGPGGFGLAGQVLHGEGVVKAKDGTYKTESVQTGKASAVSATSVTVTSDDGFKRTYILSTDTRGTAKDATTVTVVATKDGSAWDAEAVNTPSDHPGFWGGGRGHHGPHGPRNPASPKPSSSASPSASAPA